MFYYEHNSNITLSLLLLLKYLSNLVLLLGMFNSTAFPHDLTSRSGLTTGIYVHMVIYTYIYASKIAQYKSDCLA